jgi:hypothetical protein
MLICQHGTTWVWCPTPWFSLSSHKLCILHSYLAPNTTPGFILVFVSHSSLYQLKPYFLYLLVSITKKMVLWSRQGTCSIDIQSPQWYWLACGLDYGSGFSFPLLPFFAFTWVCLLTAGQYNDRIFLLLLEMALKLRQSFLYVVCTKFWADCDVLMYTSCWHLMNSVGRNGS